MPAREVVQALAGATLAISATIPSTYDAAGYADSAMVYTPVGEIETYGNHGVRATIIEFTPVDTSVVAKVKGSKNYGNMAITVGNLPADQGQALLNTASESNAHYSVKIVYDDGIVHYLDVLVASFEYQDGSVNDVQKIATEMAVCRKPVEVAAP